MAINVLPARKVTEFFSLSLSQSVSTCEAVSTTHQVKFSMLVRKHGATCTTSYSYR